MYFEKENELAVVRAHQESTKMKKKLQIFPKSGLACSKLIFQQYPEKKWIKKLRLEDRKKMYFKK